MKKMFCLFTIIGFLSGCADYYIGKRFPHGDFPKFDESSNHHRVIHEHLVLDYDYSINLSAKAITFDGSIELKKDESISSEWKVRSFQIQVYFLDKNKKVINIGYLSLSPRVLSNGKKAYEPIPFKKTFHHDPKYAFVTFGYQAELR